MIGKVYLINAACG